EDVENLRREATIARRHEPPRLFQHRNQRVHARIDTDEERLIDERNRAAVRSLRGQITAAGGRVLRAEEAHFKIHDLLLLVRSKAVALSTSIGCVNRLMSQVAEK